MNTEIRKKREAIASLYPNGREVIITSSSRGSYYVPNIPLIAMNIKYENSPSDYITVLHHEFAHHYYRRFMKEIFELLKQYKGRDKLQLLLNIFEDAFIERNHPYLPLKKFIEHAHRMTSRNNPIPLQLPHAVLIWHYDLREYYDGVPQKLLDDYYREAERLYEEYEALRLKYERKETDAEPILQWLLQFLTEEEKEQLPANSNADDEPPPFFDYENPASNPNPFFGHTESRNYLTPEEYSQLEGKEKKLVLARGINVERTGESNLQIEPVSSDNSLLNEHRKERHYGYGTRVHSKKLLRWRRKTLLGSMPTMDESPLYRWKNTEKPSNRLVLIIDTSLSMNEYADLVNQLLQKLQFDMVIEFNSTFFIRQAPRGKKLKVHMKGGNGGTVFPEITLPDADRYTFLIITDGDVANPNDILQFKGRHKTLFIIPSCELWDEKRQTLIPNISLEEAIKNPARIKELLS